MPAPELLRAQTGPEDGKLFEVGLNNSLFVPVPHQAFTDDVEQKLIYPQQATTFGFELKFDVEKDSTLLRDLDLVFTPPPLTIPGDGTYIRYSDWLPLAMIESVEWKYAGNNIHKYNSMDIVYSNIKYMSSEHKSIWQYLMLGETSAAERNTYSASPDRPLRCMIPAPWKFNRSSCPIVSSLANKLTCFIKLRQPSYFIQTDGTKPASLQLTNYSFDKRVIHFNGDTRSELAALCNTPEGVAWLFDDVQILKYVIPAGTLGARDYAIEIRDVEGPVSKIDFILRTTNQTNPTLANTDPYAIDASLLNGLNFKLMSNNMDIKELQNVNVDEPFTQYRYYGCNQETNQFSAQFTELPICENVAGGSINFGNLTNPKVILTSTQFTNTSPSTNPNEELELTLLAHRYNWNIEQRGNYQRVWR